MAEKSLGYVELEWTCPSCNTRNPGTATKCKQCGTPMPEDVKFEQAAEEKVTTEEAVVAAVKAGPDIYCAYCGTRNASTATACRQCGALLAEGAARATAGVLGGLRDQPAPPQKCPSCGTENAATALKCRNCGAPMGKAVPATPPPTVAVARPAGMGFLPLLLLGLLALLAVFFFIGGRSSSVTAQVVDHSWRRVVSIEALVPVTREGWLDELPAGVEVGNCRKEVYQTVSQPVPNSREVCGTPYVVDTGTGYGEVRQECQYEVLADFCQYRTLAWTTAPSLVLEGRDLNPQWPAISGLAQNQRAGGRNEQYVIVFRANDRDYTYTTGSIDDYLAFARGGQYNLTINGFGQITKITQ